MKLHFPLTTDLLAIVPYWLKVIRSRLQNTCSLTISQFRALGCLEQYGAVLCPYELSEKLEISPSTVAFIVDSLEEIGLLKRKLNSSNHRVIEVELSKEGSNLARRGYETIMEVEFELLKPLGGYLQYIFNQGIEISEDNYLALAHTDKYLIDRSSLNALVLYRRRLSAVLNEFSLNSCEFRILFELATNLRKTCVSDLAHVLLSEKSDVTIACNKLMNSGYILKSQSIEDKRMVFLDITDTGFARVWQSAPQVDAVFLHAAVGRTENERNMTLKASQIITRHQRKSFVGTAS